MQSNSLEDDEPNHFSKIFRLKTQYKTDDEFMYNLKRAEREQFIQPTQRKFMENYIKLSRITVYDIMTHRIDIKAVEKNTNVKHALEIFSCLKYSKIPVYENDIDSIIGVCYVKDLFFLSCKSDFKDNSIWHYAQKPIFVPETMKCEKLLLQMNKEQKHLAIVVDEYGGTSGIVSFKDILDVIFKTTAEEISSKRNSFTVVDDSTIILKGDTNLMLVSEFLNIKIKENCKFDTIGGFLVDVLGRIPDENEQPVVEYAGVEFKILSVSRQHIDRVRAKKKK